MHDTLTIEAKELYRSISNATSIKLTELDDKADTLLRTTKAKLMD